MRPHSPASLWVFWLAAFLCALIRPAAAADPSVTAAAQLEAADRQFNSKSYAAALEGYRRILASGVDLGERRPEVEYRYTVCLGKAGRWDEAIWKAKAFIWEHPRGIWQARGQYWLGRLLIAVPHQGYRVGHQPYRGSSVPLIEGGERPQPVRLDTDDQQQALAAFEAAKRAFEQERGSRAITPEEIDLDFDLARLLQGAPLTAWPFTLSTRKWPPPGDPSWQIDPREPYRPEWPVPKRILYLLQQIEGAGASHVAALARFAEALFLDRYHMMMADAAREYRADGAARRIPYPYQERDAEPVLRSILVRYPDDPIADQVQFTIGQRRYRREEFVGAAAAFQELLRTRPTSRWCSDAHDFLFDLRRHQISLDTGSPQPPGKHAHLLLKTANMRRVSLRAYRVRLEDLFREGESRKELYWSFQDLVPWFLKRHGEAALGPAIARWEVSPHDRGDYREQSETVMAPIERPGAYLIVASEETAPSRYQLAASGLLLVTDRILVQEASRTHLVVFVADARTGSPVEGARVLAREYSAYEGPGQFTRMAEGQTNGEGMFEMPLTRAQNGLPSNTDTLAWAGDRYAVSAGFWSGLSYPPGDLKLYSYTDRPLYRPSQTVHFRQLVALQRGGRVVPAAGEKIVVTVADPQGKTIMESTLTTDAYGAAAGQFTLADEPPLGEYTINARVEGAKPPAPPQSGNRFRVEEYRKPEFAVGVIADRVAVRVGERAHARVRARYYFGAPVPSARVVYRVFHTWEWPSDPSPRPYDFLFSAWSPPPSPLLAYRGELVSTGETRTDAKGIAEVSFPTKPNEFHFRGGIERYTIEAEVTDPGRRTAAGRGAVLATAQQFFASLETAQNFYTQGERVPVALITGDANGHPVPAEGRLKVYLRRRRGHRIGERLIHEAPLRKDMSGAVKTEWVADRPGAFRIAFEARDAWKQKITASFTTLVVGPDVRHTDFLQRGLQLVMATHTVPEGDRARALLITGRPDATVLLTAATDDEILSREVIHMANETQVVGLPVDERHAPNFYLQAVTIHDGKVDQSAEEIRVPPLRRLLNLKVTAGKGQYRPGERATFHLAATDWQGRPVRGAFSVGVVDRSLLAIQNEYAPDIRSFFYADHRYQHIGCDPSTVMKWKSYILDTQVGPKEESHDWTMPEGMGRIEQWPGLAPLGYEGSFDREFGSDRFGGSGGAFAIGGGFGGFGGSGGFGGGGSISGVPAAGAASQPDAGTALLPTTVRTHFADTAFWTPSLVTDEHGEATISFNWPDDLTTWRLTVRGWTEDAQVGNASTEVVTHKDLLVRLQAPRFLVDRDQVVLSANVRNYLSQAKRARVRLEIEGDELALGTDKGRGMTDAGNAADQWIDVPRDGEARVDWAVRVRHEGTVKIRMIAQTDEEADAVELSFPVIVHGVEKLTVTNGALLDADAGRQTPGARRQTADARRQTPDASAMMTRPAGPGVWRLASGVSQTHFTIDVPRARKPGSTELNIQLTPSVAGTMLDALPYLADYPYGCIEQTMSRFLPSVVVAKTLQDLGLRLEDLEERAESYSAERTGGGSHRVANSPYTYPQGMPGSSNVAEAASTLWYWRLDHTPVFHTRMLRDMVTTGLQRVVAAQNGDGGWGWWPGMPSDPYMTAYVLYGLQTARAAGWSVPDPVMAPALQFVKHSFLEGDDLPLMAYQGSVLALDAGSRAAIRPLLAGRLFERRERLSPYCQALLATALYRVGESEKAKVLLANLENTAKVDEANGTVHWEGNSGAWWRWYENKVETSAAVLQAILLIQPEATLPSGAPQRGAGPVPGRLAPMIVKWLVNNRRGEHWFSTKETAMAVYALADYVRINRELAPDYAVTVDFDGRQRRTYQVTAANVLFFDNRFIVPDALIHDGVQTVTITKTGPGSLYYSAFLRTFSLEDDIHGTGNEIFVRRRYFRLLPEAGGASEERVRSGGPGPGAKINADRAQTLLPRYAEPMADIYRRVPLTSGDELQSGDLIEVELFLESKDDYDYLAFEDVKPAGCEPVELRSGGREENGLWSQMELRDQKVAFFLPELPQGTRTLTYRLRAEIPGQFHVLPTNGYAMYAPEIRTLSDELRFGIQDRPETVVGEGGHGN